MVFSTIIFLFRFLPITLALYYLAPAKLKNTVLFLCSLVFYCWGEVRFFPVMVALILINYVCGLAIEHFDAKPALRKVFLLIALIGSLGMLFYFKYANFVLRSANALLGTAFAEIQGIGTLPLGISFYTFQTLSYTIDVYRRDVETEHNIIDFGAYVVMFPQLIAGPIVKYETVAQQIDHRKEIWADFSAGCSRFIVGLGKKVLLSNQLAVVADRAFGQGDGLSASFAWLGALCYTLQIYYDFSGYSDMAIGLGRIFGFRFNENFDHPYCADSVGTFWRRWHMSLTSWFRDYLYIPLGGNRVSKPRLFFNLLVVWAATGIWHGASWNFVLWGLYFWVLLLVEKFVLLRWLKRAPGAVGHLYTLFFVLVSWTIFAIEDFGQLGEYLKVMFGLGGVPLIDGAFKYYAANYLPVLCISALAATPLGAAVYRRLNVRTAHILGAVLILAGLLLCTAYLVDGTYNPFLYFRF